jgi:hypothetical protein
MCVPHSRSKGQALYGVLFRDVVCLLGSSIATPSSKTQDICNRLSTIPSHSVTLPVVDESSRRGCPAYL